MPDNVIKSDEEWRQLLTPLQYEVTRRKGTEPPFTGKYYNLKENGTYRCVCCGNELFSSEAKFDSGTGWPSFRAPVSGQAVETAADTSCGMVRTEVSCEKCGAHIGHVFEDGPQPTGLRYCVNSVALDLVETGGTKNDQGNPPNGNEVATLAGGCFWCLEAVFQDLSGIKEVVPGYSGGKLANPSYNEVCTGTTGHAEAVQIVFDPSEISYKEILEVFFTVHDPTTLNRQGADIGPQYRSAIFYHNEGQKAIAEEVIQRIEAARVFNAAIVTELTPFSVFYPAEDYHQEYFKRNPEQRYCRFAIAPKVAKFRKIHSDKLKMPDNS